MSCISITETGLLALVGLVCGFFLKAQHQVHQSRCNRIGFCGITCERNVLTGEDIAKIEVAKQEEKIENIEIPTDLGNV
tara:strand:+ start:245 stop:481 length:237 start_codon:yes stop_codon:yes gene_type:complete